MNKKIVGDDILYDIDDKHFDVKNNLKSSRCVDLSEKCSKVESEKRSFPTTQVEDINTNKKCKYTQFDNELNNIIIEEDIKLKEGLEKINLKHNILSNSFTNILKYKTDTCNMMKNIIEVIELEDYKKIIFIDRYWRILNDYENKHKTYKLLNNIGSSITLFGTVVTPALLTIQDKHRETLFWLTWGVSLTTGLVTSLMSLFSVSKKCYISKRIYQKLISEGWSYLSLSCKYSIYKSDENPHSCAFNDFFSRVEKILKISQIKEIHSRESNSKNSRIEELSRISILQGTTGQQKLISEFKGR